MPNPHPQPQPQPQPHPHPNQAEQAVYAALPDDAPLIFAPDAEEDAPVAADEKEAPVAADEKPKTNWRKPSTWG
eukprot:scaffold54104_cov56-Phaeocystis_antarctica.AAC.2